MAASSKDSILAALRDLVAGNSDSETGEVLAYCWEVIEVDLARALLSVRLTFLEGHGYCCFELGCHVGLMDRRSWQRLRSLCDAHGVPLPQGPVAIHVEVVVSVGARCRLTGVDTGFHYSEILREPA